MPSLLAPRFSLQDMSDKKSPPRKEKPFIVRTAQFDGDRQGMKRKLLSPGSPIHDDDDKRTPNKRKRGSVSLEASPIPSHLTTPKTPGTGSRSVPLSERQQLAMIMRMADESAQDVPVKSLSPGPIHPLKRTPIDKKVHKRNERGELPIHIAAIKGDVKLTKKLIKAGADVNVADFAGWTPLHEASNRGWLYVARQLLKAGANVNVQGLENDTPLHDASINGHRKLVELLLKHGANPLQPNSNGRTALDVAATQEMVKILKKETIYSGSDTSSIDDIRSPMSPDSIISIKEEDQCLDSDDLQQSRSGSFSSNRRLIMPKSPDTKMDSKMASPRLCLKFQMNQKTKDSGEPMYKSYSVTNVSLESGGIDNPMFSPVDSPASSVDSDLYNPGFEFSSGKLKISLPEDEFSQAQSQTQLLSNVRQNLMLPASVHNSDRNVINFKAMELFPPDNGVYNNKNHDSKNNNLANKLTTGDNKYGLKHDETHSFLPQMNWQDSSSKRAESPESLDLNTETAHSSPSLVDISSRLGGGYSEAVRTNVESDTPTSSTTNCESETRNHLGGPQFTVTSTTGVNTSVFSTSNLVERDKSVNFTNSQTDLTKPLDLPVSDKPQVSNSDLVSCVSNSVSSYSNTTSTNCLASEAESSQMTSLKWELRSTSSTKSEDGIVSDSSTSIGLTPAPHNVQACPSSPPPTRTDKESKSDSRESRPSSPKVPPLKIIIPTKSQALSTSETNNERLKLVVTNVKSSLPYVINPYLDQDREAEPLTVIGQDLYSGPASNHPQHSNYNLSPAPNAHSNANNTMDKVNMTKGEDSSDSDKLVDVEVDSISNLNSGNGPQSLSNDGQLNDMEESKCDSDAKNSDDKKEKPTPRVLRSTYRSQTQSETTKSSKPQLKPQQQSDRNSLCDSASNPDPLPSVTRATKEDDEINIHPRKRKINRPKSDATSEVNSPEELSLSSIADKVPNPYDMYLALRKKIASCRQSMVNICPKSPQGFKDYLLKTCNYVLQGNNTSTLSVPTLSPPNSVKDKLRDLFVQQEASRYKLRLQHLIEREKLMLSIEQEILREHGRSARALVNQGTPLSACSILKDQEIYNMNNTDTLNEEKDKKNRTRYNGRQFLSWIQDVDDKYEKIKDLLILRQKQEADSLYAIQKLEWEWRLKELGHCDRNITPDIDELHIPLVQVHDNFDLLPT